MTEFIIKDESTDIDLDIVNLMKIYKVREQYKSTQKTNGKIIPYEKIEKSLFKDPAN